MNFWKKAKRNHVFQAFTGKSFAKKYVKKELRKNQLKNLYKINSSLNQVDKAKVGQAIKISEQCYREHEKIPVTKSLKPYVTSPTSPKND